MVFTIVQSTLPASGIRLRSSVSPRRTPKPIRRGDSRIIRQAHLDCGYDTAFWMDCPPDSLTALFAMLDTHRRRLLKKLFDGDSAHGFLGFDPSVVYAVKPSGGVSMVFDKEAYSDLNSIRLNVR